jgi:hypothetical protein
MLYQVLGCEVLNKLLHNVYESRTGKSTAISWHTPGRGEEGVYSHVVFCLHLEIIVYI